MTRELPAQVGERIGNYRLEKVIAQGGMGSVYLGRHVVLGRPGAIKVLDDALAHNTSYVERFMREARVVNDVRHPNIVDIVDFVHQRDPVRVACVMELLEGPTLAQALASRRLTAQQTLNVMHQLVSALGKVHSRGIIHRDLKPSNVVVVGSLASPLAVVPSVKILDFGIAKVFEGSNASQTGPGTMLGTPAYMAPEQVSGDVVSAATDVYALSELLFELLTGERAFSGPARQVIKLKMIGQTPEIVLDAALPQRDRVAALIRRGLDNDPLRRPSLEELEALLHDVRLHVPTAPPPAVAELPEEHEEPEAPEESVTTPSEPLPVDQDVRAEDAEVRRLGDYSLFIALPPRGMTQSYIARRDKKIEICVLRRLLRQLETNETATARFRREAKIAQYLRHPRIARVFDARVIEGTFCIASEIVLGVTLERLLNRMRLGRQPFPLQVFAPIAIRFLDALHYAHEATDEHGRPLNIVHRDLTPAALSLAFSGDVKLQDFGVARASVDDFRTAPGTAVGSLEYMSPEQVRSEDVDRRSDVYSAAAVLFEILAGRKLIEPTGVLETLRSVATDVPPPLTSLRPDIPIAVSAAIERALAKNRELRPASAAVFASELANGLGSFANASAETIGDYVRQVLPDEEQQTLEMLAQVRSAGQRSERTSAPDEPAIEPTMTVRRRRIPITDESDAKEPDLLTMPGLPAPLEQATKAFVPPAEPSTPRVGLLIAAGATALLALVTAAALLVRPSEQTSAPPRDEPPAAVAPSVAAPQASARSEAPGATARAPEPAPVVTKSKAPVAKIEPSEQRRPPPRPKTAPKPPPKPEPAPAPPVERAAPATRYGDIRRALARLDASPGDIPLFDEIHAKISKASARLPPASREKVRVRLDAAQRTYKARSLEAALDRLELETARNER